MIEGEKDLERGMSSMRRESEEGGSKVLDREESSKAGSWESN